ncbi:LAFE_0F07250g1_1 [Lachancea fermentati]|uniref:LAFE_0F07250g1_1 n=1 Tax=Lachancea fermentati TaxID=4955 RepID=A0A1G4MFE4_LACFM|nr:LAFE_0F07250g1_1 [Lachancea fermentati]
MSSVREKYKSLVDQFTSQVETSTLRQDSNEFQELLTTVIEGFLQLKTTVYSSLALFSKNESLEDLTTSSMDLLGIDYYLGLLVARKQAIQVKSPRDRSVLRLKFLQKSVQLLVQFLVSLQDYEILDTFLSKKLDGFESTYSPRLDDLYSQPNSSKDLSGAQLKRQQKIELYQLSKKVDEALDRLEKDKDSDDETLRQLKLCKLRQLSYKAFGEIEQILYEIELLTNFTSSPPPEHDENPSVSPEKSSSTDFTDKLETLNKPLLSKNGKILRNFTLTDSKSQLQKKVFGYGQYGPTMTVEEFLEKEFESGRVLQGGEEPEEDQDEDKEEWQDRETYKAREWDEFKEANPKGQGNTINRG